jgi:hypothetical protein
VVVLHAEPDFALLSAEALGAIAAFLRSWARWACLDEGISSFYPPNILFSFIWRIPIGATNESDE